MILIRILLLYFVTKCQLADYREKYGLFFPRHTGELDYDYDAIEDDSQELKWKWDIQEWDG